MVPLNEEPSAKQRDFQVDLLDNMEQVQSTSYFATKKAAFREGVAERKAAVADSIADKRAALVESVTGTTTAISDGLAAKVSFLTTLESRASSFGGCNEKD